MATSIVQILCPEKYKKNEEKKRETTRQAVGIHTTCWKTLESMLHLLANVSLHTHKNTPTHTYTHTHTITLILILIYTFHWPIKVARHLSSLSFLPQKKREENKNTLTRLVDQPNLVFFFFADALLLLFYLLQLETLFMGLFSFSGRFVFPLVR